MQYANYWLVCLCLCVSLACYVCANYWSGILLFTSHWNWDGGVVWGFGSPCLYLCKKKCILVILRSSCHWLHSPMMHLDKWITNFMLVSICMQCKTNFALTSCAAFKLIPTKLQITNKRQRMSQILLPANVSCMLNKILHSWNSWQCPHADMWHKKQICSHWMHQLTLYIYIYIYVTKVRNS